MSQYYNCFDVLGVPQNSSLEVCKSAYRKLVKKYHPDVNKDPEAVKKFMLVQKAWNVLTGKERGVAAPPPQQPQRVVVVIRYGGFNGSSTSYSWNGSGDWY